METIDPWGMAEFWRQGHDWHNLCRGPLAIAIIKAAGLVVSEKKIFYICFH